MFNIIFVFYLTKGIYISVWGKKRSVKHLLTLFFTMLLYLMVLAEHSCGVTVFFTGFYFTGNIDFDCLGWPKY